jgi:hypothetical protein
MSAESRWLNDGVTLDDLSYMIDTHWPFDQHIGSSGFPIAGNFSYEIYREEESAIRLLMDSMNHIRKSRLDAEIAKSLYVAILLRTIGAFHAELRLTFDQFQAIEQNLPDDYGLYLNIFAIRDISSTNRDEYFDYIDQLGRTRDWLPFFSSPDNLKPQVETYANAFIEHPERSGLLEPLSVFAQEGSTSSIPTYLLDPKRHSDLRFQLAALIIRIAQSDWDPREAQELAKYSAEFITNEPGICEKIMRVVTANNLNGPNVEAFLLELRRLLVTAKSESIDQVILALDNSLRHRTTHLRERWSDLGLPKGLHTLIQV